MKPVIFSCEGPVLTEEERQFFKSEDPFGFILFARNVEAPDQLQTLIRDLRDSVGREDAPVLVDQEGGRVQRLRSPHWYEAPSFGRIGTLYDLDPEKGREAARFATQLISADLLEAGFSVNCSPCLDLSFPETSSVIGDRSFHRNPAVVAELGAIVAETYMDAGIMPVIKHMPGHGRALVDSHIELPSVATDLSDLSENDFAPFKALSKIPWGMTAHIVFENIDPSGPATQSPKVIEDIIRRKIGFEGLLLTDDLNMEALDGSLAVRAERALEAGVDIILHCSGKLAEMREVASACPSIRADSLERYQQSRQVFEGVKPFDRSPEEVKIALNRLLSELDR